MRSPRSLSWLGLSFVLGLGVVSACGSEPTGNSGGAAAGGSTTGTSTGGTVVQGGGGSGASSSGGLGGSLVGGAGGVSAGGTGGTSTGGAGTGGAFVPIEVACVNQTYQCGDTLDNDGDGLIDSQDPDCLGPCDNTEDGYYGGIPGQPGPPCEVDCYWDSNSGSGDDDCYWSHQCDPNEAMPPGHPEPQNKCPYNLDANLSGTPLGCSDLYSAQSNVCASVCGPLTPNGCDCFGCCELPAGSGKYVWLGSEDEATGMGSCFADVIDDPTKCEPCEPVAGCLNDCDTCELCIGKDTLPPECFPSGSGGAGGTGSSSSSSSSSGSGGASSSSSSSSSSGSGGTGGSTGQCPDGVQPCGLPGQAQCPAEYYCITGCCQLIQQPK